MAIFLSFARFFQVFDSVMEFFSCFRHLRFDLAFLKIMASFCADKRILSLVILVLALLVNLAQAGNRCDSACANEPSCASGRCKISSCFDTGTCYQYCVSCKDVEQCYGTVSSECIYGNGFSSANRLTRGYLAITSALLACLYAKMQ